MEINLYHQDTTTGDKILKASVSVEDDEDPRQIMEAMMQKHGPKNPLPDPDKWTWFADVSG